MVWTVEWDDDFVVGGDGTRRRRLGTLRGVPWTLGRAQRANVNYYMLRDVRIADADELIAADVSGELAQASRALATGRSLLA